MYDFLTINWYTTHEKFYFLNDKNDKNDKKRNYKKMIKELKNINIPNYNTFSNVNIAYLDHVEKIWSVVNKIIPFEDLMIKTFDAQVSEAIEVRGKRL